MVSGSGEPCPVFRPTVEEFSRPFCEYVRGVLASHKDIAMFKVIPPEGWRPRVGSFPDLDTIVISCPIRQHVSPEIRGRGQPPRGWLARLLSPGDVWP